MRLPNESELSREQREVCQAPLTGTTLVIGPPGSGKTVVAVFRQETAQKMGVPARVAVHNRVLSQFTSLEGTFQTWLNEWWRKCTGYSSPPRVYTGKRGYQPVDFKEAAKTILKDKRQRSREHGNWGHLILDEAQDFSEEAHKLLSLVPTVVFCDVDETERPSLTILADENQRITGENSTIEDIKEAHHLTADDVYTLTKNYRNTREIAEVARHFHVGAATGVPELPTRRGDKPELIFTADSKEAVSRIGNYALLHPEQEIGVLVQYSKTRDRIYSALKRQLSNRGIRVQKYDSKDRDNESLVFDKPGTVTVICFSSSKGLEFDSVFLPELQTLRVDGAAEDFAKMTLYVMCSRARSRLVLMIDKSTSRHDPVWRILPRDEHLKRLFDIG